MNETVTDRLNRTSALYDDQAIVPAPLPARNKHRDVMLKPMHSTTQSTMASTSEFARYFLLALPSRYIFRSLSGATFDAKAPNWLRTPVNDFLDRYMQKNYAAIDAYLKGNPLENLLDTNITFNKVSIGQLLDESAPKVKQELGGLLKKFSADHLTNETLEEAYKRFITHPEKGVGLGSTSKAQLRDAARAHVGNRLYATVLGVGSMALTFTYANMVYKDIKNLFSEAVGFEMNKPPEQVNFIDICNSENEIVQQTLKNFWRKTAERAITDIPFFAAVRYPNLHLSDMMIGVKGFQLFTESWRRRNTMFEDLLSLVNNKINPHNGLGDTISTAEILDLYQHYHYHRKSGPAYTFNTIIERDTSDSQVWAKSQQVFGRIAELINQTYAYKHESKLAEDGSLLIRANFALPQFIYMLGNNLINPKEPERTLAYIETANSHGMQAVKEAQAMFSKGMSVEAVMERFPIDRRLPSNQHLDPDYPHHVRPQPLTQQRHAPPRSQITPHHGALEGRIAQAAPALAGPATS